MRRRYKAQSMTRCCLAIGFRSAIWLTITELITMRHLRGAVRKPPQALKRSFFYPGKIDELGLSKVLVIENSGEQVAKTVIENTKNKNAEILTQDSMQSVTKKQIADGYTYLSAMEKNLEVLKAALN